MFIDEMKKNRKISGYPFLIFFLFVIIAYLPVLLPFFHLKNDLITQISPHGISLVKACIQIISRGGTRIYILESRNMVI
jgi:hypothetical protein